MVREITITEQLSKLIEEAPKSTLRSILRALCSDPTTARRAIEIKHKIEDHETFSDRKRTLPEIQICTRCNETFDDVDSDDDEQPEPCMYHEGELEVDWDNWPDHDERCHGPIDTPRNRRDHPEGFVYSCCDQPGDSEGCTEGEHEAAFSKRVRY